MEQQVANSFDIVTLRKIIKGGLISALGSTVLAILGYIGTLQFNDPTLTVAVSFLVPFLTNLVLEYQNGIVKN